MPPTTYKAVHVGDVWCVMQFEGGEAKAVVASDIRSHETARVIAALLRLNSWSADELESGRVDLVRCGVEASER